MNTGRTHFSQLCTASGLQTVYVANEVGTRVEPETLRDVLNETE